MKLKRFSYLVGAASAAIDVEPVFNRQLPTNEERTPQQVKQRITATSYLLFSNLNCRSKLARDPNILRHPIAAEAAPTKNTISPC